MHIATAMNAGLTIAGNCPDPYIGPIFAYVEALMHLTVHPAWCKGFPNEEIRLAMLTLINTDLGGLPFFQLPSFLYMGHQDKATECLALLKKVWDMFDLYRPVIAGLTRFTRGLKSDTAMSQLVLNPTSLNIAKPAQAEGQIKKIVEDFLLTSLIVNKQLKHKFALVDPKNVHQITRTPDHSPNEYDIR